jgi:hypothetical protein
MLKRSLWIGKAGLKAIQTQENNAKSAKSQGIARLLPNLNHGEYDKEKWKNQAPFDRMGPKENNHVLGRGCVGIIELIAPVGGSSILLQALN